MQAISSIAALTVAGSDSGGGAGIQADLHTFAAHDLHGCSVITAVTAQNTVGVDRALMLPPDLVSAQLACVMRDLPIRAAKTGMLGTGPIIDAVADAWGAHREVPLVVDPVMVATSGDRLLDADAVGAMVSRLFPLAAVITPNRAEALALTGTSEPLEAAARIGRCAPRAIVVVKGGHADADAADLTPRQARDWVHLPAHSGGRGFWVAAPWITTRATHGTGCTFSAAIAAGMARGLDAVAAIRAAKAYLTGALRHARPIGTGHGPVDHRWRQRAPDVLDPKP